MLKRVGVFIEVQHLKALLKELGFHFNGPSASLTVLFSACKAFLHGISGGYTDGFKMQSSVSGSEFSSFSNTRVVHSQDTSKLLGVIKDIIYTSNMTLYELFKQGATNGTLEFDGFAHICDIVSERGLTRQEIESAWRAVPKTKSGNISF